MPHRLERILLRNPDQGIRIMNAKMSFHGIVEPRQAQDLYLAAPMVDIHVTVESSVQQHVPRVRTSPSGEAGLGQASGQHDGGVALEVAMTRSVRSTFQFFDARSDRPVLMGLEHAFA
jgi:hypothetical protein